MSGERRRKAFSWVRRRVQLAGGPEKITKARLAELAEKVGLKVKRSDGKDGEPRKADYLEAFGL